MAKLRDIASVIPKQERGALRDHLRPYVQRSEHLRTGKANGVINKELFAKLYKVPEEQCDFLTFDGAYAFKCTIPRPIPAGDVGDSDVYGRPATCPPSGGGSAPGSLICRGGVFVKFGSAVMYRWHTGSRTNRQESTSRCNKLGRNIILELARGPTQPVLSLPKGPL